MRIEDLIIGFLVIMVTLFMIWIIWPDHDHDELNTEYRGEKYPEDGRHT